MSRDRYDVATMLPSDKGRNTLVLGGIDLTVPLEMDLDDDPLQDDEVRLVRSDGHFERVLKASDADVTREEGGERLFYRFRDVPPGVYAVQSRISAEEWAPVIEGVLVTTRSAQWNGRELDAEPAAFTPTKVDPDVHEVITVTIPEHGYYEYAGDDTE